MKNPLVKSPVTDKNGVHTTRNKKAANTVPTRSLPPSQASAYEEVEPTLTELPLDSYEKQVTFAAGAIFEAARNSPGMREKLDHVGHEMLSAFASVRIIIKRQRELIALLEDRRVMESSKQVKKWAPYLLGKEFVEITGENGKAYLKLPDGVAVGGADPETADIDAIRAVAAEWEALAAAVQNYRDAHPE